MLKLTKIELLSMSWETRVCERCDERVRETDICDTCFCCSACCAC